MDFDSQSGLGQLLYISDAAEGIDRDALEQIRETSAYNNAERDITGILFFSDGHFVQLLEGNPPTIRELFDDIVQDDRHDNVKLLFERPARERLFYEWDMALLDLDGYSDNERLDLEDLVHLAGYQVKDHNDLPMDLKILRKFRVLLPA